MPVTGTAVGTSPEDTTPGVRNGVPGTYAADGGPGRMPLACVGGSASPFLESRAACAVRGPGVFTAVPCGLVVLLPGTDAVVKPTLLDAQHSAVTGPAVSAAARPESPESPASDSIAAPSWEQSVSSERLSTGTSLSLSASRAAAASMACDGFNHDAARGRYALRSASPVVLVRTGTSATMMRDGGLQFVPSKSGQLRLPCASNAEPQEGARTSTSSWRTRGSGGFAPIL